MKDKDELIWVSKEFAERYKRITAANASAEEKNKVFDEYLESITKAVRDDFKESLATLEEDAAIFSGLMLKVKQAFGKAKDEHLTASYELWEKFEAEVPSTRAKTEKLIATLTPLKAELKEINELIGKISLYNVDHLTESISRLAGSHGRNKEMIEFLVKNFNTERKDNEPE